MGWRCALLEHVSVMRAAATWTNAPAPSALSIAAPHAAMPRMHHRVNRQVRDNPTWFVTFVWCEVCLQLPFFFLATYAYIAGADAGAGF